MTNLQILFVAYRAAGKLILLYDTHPGIKRYELDKLIEARMAIAAEIQAAGVPLDGFLRCPGDKSEDGGSGGPRVPCDGFYDVPDGRGDDGTGRGCGEPCSFIMHHPR